MNKAPESNFLNSTLERKSCSFFAYVVYSWNVFIDYVSIEMLSLENVVDGELYHKHVVQNVVISCHSYCFRSCDKLQNTF